ncbi:MAG: hypothetical protein AB7F64_02600 [Gammaproteobacteria bacterium]
MIDLTTNDGFKKYLSDALIELKKLKFREVALEDALTLLIPNLSSSSTETLETKLNNWKKSNPAILKFFKADEDFTITTTSIKNTIKQLKIRDTLGQNEKIKVLWNEIKRTLIYLENTPERFIYAALQFYEEAISEWYKINDRRPGADDISNMIFFYSTLDPIQINQSQARILSQLLQDTSAFPTRGVRWFLFSDEDENLLIKYMRKSYQSRNSVMIEPITLMNIIDYGIQHPEGWNELNNEASKNKNPDFRPIVTYYLAPVFKEVTPEWHDISHFKRTKKPGVLTQIVNKAVLDFDRMSNQLQELSYIQNNPNFILDLLLKKRFIEMAVKMYLEEETSKKTDRSGAVEWLLRKISHNFSTLCVLLDKPEASLTHLEPLLLLIDHLNKLKLEIETNASFLSIGYLARSHKRVDTLEKITSEVKMIAADYLNSESLDYSVINQKITALFKDAKAPFLDSPKYAPFISQLTCIENEFLDHEARLERIKTLPTISSED